MIGAEFIIANLALKAWQDGNAEGISGMLGVAFVIRNRVRAGWYGGDWIQVLSHHQEWRATEALPDLTILPDPKNFAFRTVLQEVNNIFSGARVDDILTPVTNSVLSIPPSPALYYGIANQIDRSWYLENISRNIDKHRIIAQVGMLWFWN